MRKKKEGDTLGEKIEATLEKIKKKKVSQLLDDCFYEEIFEKGIPFKLRRSNFLRDLSVDKENDDGEVKKIHINKTMNVIDELLQRQEELAEVAEVEASRDKTYDEFLETYIEHINGKIDPSTRTANRPETAQGEGSRGGG
mmetsp:Transcript_15670/g.24025  ORF Transcript_15670/g.24025 Transcript_15670/m.24025 type:complete len:141 (-) Transcript_15670:1199-1621(-)